MSSLYELDKSLAELLENGYTMECIDMETGELDEEKAKNFLESIPMERDVKLESYALYIKNLDSDMKAIKAEIANLQSRAKAKETKADNLKDWLSQSLKLFNQTKFETPKCSLSFRKSQSVEVTNFSDLDERFINEKITRDPDRTAIKKAIKLGEEVLGAILIDNENLQIK